MNEGFPEPARSHYRRTRGNLSSCGISQRSNSWHDCTAWGTLAAIVHLHSLIEERSLATSAEQEAKGQRTKGTGLRECPGQDGSRRSCVRWSVMPGPGTRHAGSIGRRCSRNRHGARAPYASKRSDSGASGCSYVFRHHSHTFPAISITPCSSRSTWVHAHRHRPIQSVFLTIAPSRIPFAAPGILARWIASRRRLLPFPFGG